MKSVAMEVSKYKHALRAREYKSRYRKWVLMRRLIKLTDYEKMSYENKVKLEF